MTQTVSYQVTFQHKEHYVLKVLFEQSYNLCPFYFHCCVFISFKLFSVITFGIHRLSAKLSLSVISIPESKPNLQLLSIYNCDDKKRKKND